MKNKYTIFLLYLCVFLVGVIGIVQIYDLSAFYARSARDINVEMYYHFRTNQSITLILAIITVAVLFSREGINRELKRKAYTDITGIKNKHACLEEMNILDCNDNTLNIGFVMFDLNNLKKVNDFYGHEKGDELIQNFVLLLRHASDRKYFLGRFGGDEFIVIIQNCNEQMMEQYIGSVQSLTEKFNRGRTIQLSYACGYAISTQKHYYLMEDLLKEADKNMYENKKRIKSGTMLETDQISKILDTERVNLTERDNLTGIFTHDSFVSAARKVLQITKVPARLAVVCSDIFNFRYINNSYGYREGDNVLRQFAKDLSSQSFCLCAYRTYSDNFAFLADVSDMSEEEAVKLISDWSIRFSCRINQTYSGSRLIIKSGIYFITNPSESVETMLNNADCAHKYAKTSYHNISIYNDELSESARKRSEIINSFQRAIDMEEFKVYVQPKVHCSDKSISSVEALIRWQKSDGQFCYPDEFVPVFEQTGDITEMDFYVYEKVFSYLHENYLAGKMPVPIAVNVSRIHLARFAHFRENIHKLQKKYPVPSSLLIFELTESAYIQELDSARLFVEEIHKMGYKVAMDDFGSGYSSLKVLQDMPFDEIKFDRAFLNQESGQKGNKILIQMIQLVKSLNKTIVCEGVETADNVALLEQSQCDLMQGYYYYKPFPLEELRL